MQKSKSGFTMVELVFVIVILGILAAVAIPKMAATRTDAEITKGRSDIASIRSAIVTERQGRLIRGLNDYMPRLSTGAGILFTGSDANRTLLMYGIAAGGAWTQGAVNAGVTDVYTITINGVTTTFTYTVSTGRFTCTAGADDCNTLVN